MKNLKMKLLMAILIISTSARAQSTFPQEWKTDFPIKINTWRISDDRKYICGYNDKEFAVMEGTAGKVLWSGKYQEITGLKKIDFQYWIPESEVITLYTNERSTGTCQKFFLDINTGKLLWKTEEGGTSGDFVTSAKLGHYTPGYLSLKNGSSYKKVNIRTGEEVDEIKVSSDKGNSANRTNYTSFRNDDISIELKYERTDDVGFMSGRNAKPINVTCYDRKKGGTKWQQTVNGFYVHSLCNASIFDWTSSNLFGGDHLWVKVYGDRVLVIYEGMAVLDINTGELLWQTNLKISDIDFKLVALDQQQGVASLPIADIEKRRVYAVDLANNYTIKCYDLDNGKVLWESESFSKEAIIPNLLVHNGLLIAKTGGKIHTQRFVAGTNGNPDQCTKSLKEAGNNGILVYNAETGEKVWNSKDKGKEWDDKMKSTISDIHIAAGKLYVASGDNVMVLNPEDGKLLASQPLKNLKIGDMKSISLRDGSVLVRGTDGIAMLSTEDVSIKWNAKTGGHVYDFEIGNAFFVVVEEDKNGYVQQFVRVDLSNGTVLGKIKDVPYPYFSEDGEYFYRKDKNEVAKYKTRS